MNNYRQNFNDSFLSESLQLIKPLNLSTNIKFTINQLKQSDVPIVKLTDSLFKFEGETIAIYWFEDEHENILLAVELEKMHYAWVVRSVGKFNKGQPPYASDLYNAILNDKTSKKAIRISSDDQLSQEGFGIWKRLLNNGHKISVYNRNTPGQSFKTIDSEVELNQYLGSDPKFRQYQYIISESNYYPDILCQFLGRRLRELLGLSLD